MAIQPALNYENFISSGIFTLKVSSSLRRIDIHKALLGSVSAEFENHVYNDMMEGTSGEMTLADEREDTVAHFTQWAYTGDYPDPPSTTHGFLSPDDDRTESLMVHARLYVFADRFNVQDLKQRAFDKLKSRIAMIKVPNTREDRLAAIHLFGYAFNNLPKRDPSEPLLECLGLYASCSLNSLRKEPEFFELVENDIDFMKELFLHVRQGRKTPWGAPTSDTFAFRCTECEAIGRPRLNIVPQIGSKVCPHGHFCQLMVDGE